MPLDLPPEIGQEVLALVESNAAAIKAAEDELTPARIKFAEVSSRAPEVAKRLVAAGYIDATKEAHFTALCQDPVNVSTIICNVLDRQIQKAAALSSAMDPGRGYTPEPTNTNTNGSTTKTANEFRYVGEPGGANQASLQLAKSLGVI